MKTKAKILIVEDSFIVAVHLQTTLENEGYEVFAKFDSGEAALEFIEKNKPDLILMDIMLTGKLDGIETAGIIKEKFRLPVIYITALTDKDTIQRAKITEPYGYLTKPFEDREIFTVIEMALYKYRIESALRQSEEKYFSTVSSISDAVVVIDRDFKITFINPSACAMVHWVSSEAVGVLVQEVILLKDATTGEFPVNPVQCLLGSVSLSAMPDNLMLVGRNGVERPIGESSLSPLLDSRENFAGLILIFNDLTERREHEMLLRDLERQKMASLIEGQERERSRIARDLHDGLGQMLNAIKMNANVITQNHSDAANLYRLIDEAIQESIRISENLLPAKLKDFDLGTCLRSLCNQLGKAAGGIQIGFVNSSQLSVTNQFQKINLYRIAQEAINNAIKHASATSVTVQLSEDLENLRLTIEDDGKGLISQKELDLYKNNGLVNMRDRAEIMGGRLTIESDENRGTIVIAEIPMTKTLAYA
jgi:PAS domain S-box-containing protein